MPRRRSSSRERRRARDRDRDRDRDKDRDRDRDRDRVRDRDRERRRRDRRERPKKRRRDRSSDSSSRSSSSDGRRKRSSRRDRDRRSSSDSVKDEEPRRDVVERRPRVETETEIDRAIKAAEAVGLTMCKLPSYERKEVKIKEDMPTIRDRNVLDEIESDSFVQKQFTSSKNKKLPDNIVIDLDAGTVKVPDVDLPQTDSPFHPDLFSDEKVRMEKWVKKMYQFRQKALRGEI